MKLWFVEPLAGPTGRSKKETFNFGFQITLLKGKKKILIEFKFKQKSHKKLE
jgi:hypothetical protein